jgi:protein TonB
MALELLDNRNRAIGVAATLGINTLLVALLLTLSSGLVPAALRAPGLTTFDVTKPPPPAPPPDTQPAAAAAPPSRGATRAPAPPHPPHPRPTPTSVPPWLDAGSQSASGAGSAAGSGAGRGGEGNGTGAAAGGNGTGAAATQPVHVAGDLTAADYRRSGLPRGTGGQVIVSMRVRSDGRVDQCRVARSSGYAAIDEATCRLIEQRFRFRPARTAGGEPVDAQIQWAATWQPR